MDAELVADLRRAGFQGPDWEFLARVVAEYGVGVIGGWMRRGVILEECAKKKAQAPLLPDAVLQDRVHREQIAVTAVGDALGVFQQKILPAGKWRPELGAALSTYFITQCLFRYGNAVQQWQRENRRVEQSPTDPLALPDLENWHGVVPDVVDDVIRDETARRIIDGASSARAARALVLMSHGYTHAEIGRDLGMSTKAASSLIEREVTRARNSVTAAGQAEGWA